ncbi:hypothetical protein [Pseudomonas sp. OV226]|uniref:hypothetical protein n=1 Tax=Pseudomonas sp. OV226 TaxID=2135588 RepID=UPI000D6A93AA|nr:hypothetical protein [Pseudomonas sp. OV226]PWK29726.1 hypothetical protein C7534_13419 [Pseudomonas sp. OV226]
MSNGSTLILQTVLGGKPVDTGGAGLDIYGTSTLALQASPVAACTFANHLAGSGLLTVDNGGNIKFNALVPDQAGATSTITASTFSASGTGVAGIRV